MCPETIDMNYFYNFMEQVGWGGVWRSLSLSLSLSKRSLVNKAGIKKFHRLFGIWLYSILFCCKDVNTYSG